MGVNPYLTDEERSVLETARIGIAGAGGLGSNCAMHLVRAGIRRLVVCDHDVVDATNLNRQFFFRDQIGMKKVRALGENLMRIEPDLELDLRDLRIDAGNAASTFAKCDVVVEAFDSADAKAMLIGSLLPHGTQIVSASGIAGWGRSRDVDVHEVGRNLIVVGDCESGVDGDLPPTSPRVGIAAAMQANAAVALLLGHEP